MKKIFFKKQNLILIFYIITFAFLGSIIFSILFNFGFLLTDWIANKKVDWNGIFYSPVSNETWLAFWGSFSASVATILLLLHYKEQLSFDKKKSQFDFKMSTQKKEKEIVLSLLSLYDTSNIADFLQISKMTVLTSESINMLINTKKEKIILLNLKRLEVEFLTNLRVTDTSTIPFLSKNEIDLENTKLNCYKKISILHDFFLLLIEDSYEKAKNFIILREEIYKKVYSSKEYREVSIEKLYIKINKEKNINFIKFLSINNLFFNNQLNKIFNEENSQLFNKDSDVPSFSPEDEEIIIDFLKSCCASFKDDDFYKINFSYLFSMSFFISVFTSFFEETTNELTLYYRKEENYFLDNLNSYI